MSNYLTDIDPIGESEENTCVNCGLSTYDKYCSSGCKHEYNQ